MTSSYERQNAYWTKDGSTHRLPKLPMPFTMSMAAAHFGGGGRRRWTPTRVSSRSPLISAMLRMCYCCLCMQTRAKTWPNPRLIPPRRRAESETPNTASTVSSATNVAVAHRPKDNCDIQHPQLSVRVTVGLLIIVTMLVAVTVKWLVDSVDGLTQNRHISKEFIGVIILPLVCRTPDGATIVTPSVKDKQNLSIGITVGSSIQLDLSVTPFIALLRWTMDKPLTLLFDPYESIAVFLAVLTVNYVVLYDKYDWLEGIILICLYVILCATFWYYPGNNPFSSLLASYA
ncbi:hypothetical protein EDD18DRAFT_832721 [Armillaria luteobubalina]|uniref:Sodium/calcium exchanger membrane region domain-containing protein n=1 Tax=Armillaria luteobubalina TaxID=153913 RepID=A0AA39URR1_9AGAR|nr:hypothetical protein EDD18DRAFT_832721 [Armillaria luteobubalina]